MRTVGLYVEGVVDQVDPRRGHAEGDEDDGHLGDNQWLEGDAAGYRSGQHKDVLDPLTWTAGPQ